MKKRLLPIAAILLVLLTFSNVHAQVGIGTTSPASKLHIKDANTNANVSPLIIEANSNYGSPTYSGIEFRSNASSAFAGPSGRIISYKPSPSYTDATMAIQTVAAGPSFVDALLLTNGNVGIGVRPTQKLDVAGTIHASNLDGGATTLSTDASGNIIRTPSDANLKYNIADVNAALNKIMRMHGVTYDFKDAKRFGSNRHMGFLAQELEKVVPEAVSSGGEYKSVNLSGTDRFTNRRHKGTAEAD